MVQVTIKDDEHLAIRGRQARGLPIRRWDRGLSCWIAPYVTENWSALQRMGADLRDIEPPTKSYSRVEKYQRALAVFLPGTPGNVKRCREFPDRRMWKPGFKGAGAWIVSATAANVTHLLRYWPKIHWSGEAVQVRDDILKRDDVAAALAERKIAPITQVGDYIFGGKFPPYEHQKRAFVISRDVDSYALFMDPGTGKTRVVVDTTCYLYGMGKLTGVVVVAPNSVKDVWREEIATHSPDHYEHNVMVYSAGSNTAAKALEDEHARSSHENENTLSWLIVNVESMSQVKSRGYKLVREFLTRHRAGMLVVDESSKIKTPGAKRTQNIVRVGKLARYRRILTGTPSTQGPLDLFAQFKFLDTNILGFGSFYAFRNRFALVDDYAGFPQVRGYTNLDELKKLIDPYSFRVTRSECLDLPPKVYQKRIVELNKNQRRHYSELVQEMRTEFEGRDISVINALTQLLRLHQVVGGFLPPEEPDALERVIRGPRTADMIPGPNPKLLALTDMVDELPKRDKVVIWARFRAEIAIVAEALFTCYGPESVVEFHGGVSTEDRTKARTQFQDPSSKVRFFVAQTETGGIGLTLTAASYVIYYSNSFSLESRIQSEDRCHRIGQTRTVTYTDILAKDTLDSKVLSALRSKKKLADLITGDKFMNWI